MKTTKTLITAIMLMATVCIAQAQDKVKMYSFTVYLSNGTASSSCLDIDKAYVSPIVSHKFDDYRQFDEASHQTDVLNSKWAKKCQAKFTIKSTYCWGHYANSWLWKKSRSKTDEKRDNVISHLKKQGYKVYDSYLFGFYFD
tara:strand:+ start:205 stop:630 length:426 start_codon:yes stop_codon:yes gene_type:complete